MSGPDMVENPPSTATFKLGKDFNDPWLVLYGNPGTLRRQILEAFGDDDAGELSLVELIATKAVEAHAIYTLAKSGAKPEAAPKRRSAPAKKAEESKVEKPAEEVEEAEEVDDATAHVLSLIENTTTQPELKRVWAENNDAFADNDVLKLAYKNQRSTFTA